MAFATTTELAQFVERELGHELGNTASSQRTDIVSHLDRAHKIILAGGGFLNYDENGQKSGQGVNFAFARASRPKTVTLLAPIESTTITVTATNGSNAITFSADPNAGVSIAGWHIRLGSEDEVYYISSHVAASTDAVLDDVYVGTTGASKSIKAFKLLYTVGSSDILKIIGPIRGYESNRVSVVDRDELLNRYPLSDIDKDFPELATIVNESAGTYTLQFSTYAKETERVEVDYVAIPTALDTTSVNPIIPAQFRLLLGHMAAYQMLVRNDDDRAKEHLGVSRRMFQELVDWNANLYSTGDVDYGRIKSTWRQRKVVIKCENGFEES